MTRRTLLSALPLAGLSTVGCQSGVAPDFALPDAGGATVRLSDYRGKVVLLDFWATWCGGCKLELPWFVEFADAFRDRGFAVIGVSLDEEGWKAVRPFLKEKPLNFPVVVGDERLALAYDVAALPKTLLIGRDGTIVSSHTGVVDKDEMRREIEALL